METYHKNYRHFKIGLNSRVGGKSEISIRNGNITSAIL